jgi:hypothetical protein
VLGGAILGALVAIALRWGPPRGLIERAADLCSQLWERLLGTVFRRQPRPTPDGRVNE